MRGLTEAAREAFDRRLRHHAPRPLAVAFSGGGDSLALLLIADAWARDAGRELLVLTVDHGLRPDSPAWTEACAATARRLGRPFRALAWTDGKPAAGLPAAARAARHRLLAQASREAGAAVVLMGHTADDVLEARAMRAAGATTPEPHEWSPSPAWPEGRGLFLLRPVLGARRAALRAWLEARGETWIDDPANADLRFARARARPLAAAVPGPVTSEGPEPLALAALAVEAAGGFILPRAALRSASAVAALRLAALMAVCAGGGDRRPAGSRLRRAAEALRGEAPFVGTLAGARLEADASQVRAFREAGEAARGGLAPLPLPLGEPVVWDGRFEIAADREGLEVRRLAGLARRLPPDQRRKLAELPAAARGALPVVLDPGGCASCPLLDPAPAVRVRPLAGERLRAAAGLIEREPG